MFFIYDKDSKDSLLFLICRKEIVIEDKSAIEQMELIQQLDEEDKNTVFKIIDKMLTNKKFKDFFQKNVATL